MQSLAFVRGSGEIGSAVALALHRAGWRVLLHDHGRPAHTRRLSAFCDAFYEGEAWLDGVRARLCLDADCAWRELGKGTGIVATSLPLAPLVHAHAPALVVDARMRKHQPGEAIRGLAALTVGLGPGFHAGRAVDAVIETAWGESLGSVIWGGAARSASGEPRPLGGHGRDRFVHARASGVFEARREIGQSVRPGGPGAPPGHHPARRFRRGLTVAGATCAGLHGTHSGSHTGEATQQFSVR